MMIEAIPDADARLVERSRGLPSTRLVASLRAEKTASSPSFACDLDSVTCRFRPWASPCDGSVFADGCSAAW